MPPAFVAFVTAQQASWLRAAFLLTGDRTTAQDLAQETAVRVLLSWRKVEAADDPVAYARRTMLNLFLRGRQRRWHGEVPHEVLPETSVPSAYAAVDDRDQLRRALSALPPRQRAAVVLRQVERLTEAEVAVVLGCSIGNVKSLTSRGLAALRAALTSERETSHDR
jgi:RNA polymerase sigma-70 factor (sigma-E family)